jgi:response regulator RpfG family c-di-GMP phosphodiesterase
MKHKILMVDDERPNIRLLERLFSDRYECFSAVSVDEALVILDQHDVAVIITDQRMPRMTGIDLLKRSADRRPHMVRILLTGYTDLEALVEAINCGLVYMYVQKPWNNEDLKLRMARAIEHYEQNRQHHSLAATNERLQMRIKETRAGVIKAFGDLLKLKDEEAYAHGSQASRLATNVAESFGLAPALVEDVATAALLHELGALGSSYRPSAASAADFSCVRHTDVSVQVLSEIPDLSGVVDVLRCSHENLDGSGNPLGLIGEQIPLASQIMRVADEYELLTNPRNGSVRFKDDEAIAELMKGAGTRFDGRVIKSLADLVAQDSRQVHTPKSGQSAYYRHELVTH